MLIIEYIGVIIGLLVTGFFLLVAVFFKDKPSKVATEALTIQIVFAVITGFVIGSSFDIWVLLNAVVGLILLSAVIAEIKKQNSDKQVLLDRL